MNRPNTIRKGATWKPRRTTKSLRASTATRSRKALSSGMRKTVNSAHHSTAGSISKQKRKHSKHSKPIERIPFPNRLDDRSYITKSGRVRLFGADMTMLREQAFMRSQGQCEAELHHPDCPREVTWTTGELAHKSHGANKTDTLEGTEFRSSPCHQIMQHASNKPQGVK